jgi:hypothetical protein
MDRAQACGWHRNEQAEAGSSPRIGVMVESDKHMETGNLVHPAASCAGVNILLPCCPSLTAYFGKKTVTLFLVSQASV